MMKKSIYSVGFSISLILALDVLSFTSPKPERPQFYSHNEQVVLLDNGCSGFVIKASYLITAKHCVKYRTSVTAHFENTLYGTFSVVSKGNNDTTHDWVLLKGDTGKVLPTTLSQNQPSFGDLCYQIGYGDTNEIGQHLTQCYVLGDFGDGYFRLAANFVPGDSGSPIFDNKGYVIGMVTRSYFPRPIGYGVSLVTLSDVYRSLK